MRFIALGLALALAAIPALQAQEPVVPVEASAEQTDPRPAEVSIDPAEATLPPPRPEGRQANHEAAETGAVRETSARNLLAIIGAVVVVVALIAFLR
jgi:hypothetical protein